MQAGGLEEVANPSELFLAERPEHAPGSVVLPASRARVPCWSRCRRWSRPRTRPSAPDLLGFDANRAALLVAVLDRRARLELVGCDVFVNIAGGLSTRRAGGGSGVAMALASSFRNQPIVASTIVFGEIGLAGELRAVIQVEARLTEAAKLGFTQAILPAASLRRVDPPPGIRVLPARTLEEALELGAGV